MTDKYAPCPCGSGEKYKFCCLGKDGEAAAQVWPDPRLVQRVTETERARTRKRQAIADALEAGRIDRAERLARALVRDDPEQSDGHFYLGTCCMARQDSAGAIPHLERAKAIEALPEFSFNLASAYLHEARLRESVQAFREVIATEGEDPDTAALARQRLAELEEGTLRTSGVDLATYLARMERFDEAFDCLKQGRYEAAIEGFEAVLADAPDHVQSHGNLGLVHARLGNRERALAHLDRALALDPDYTPALTNRQVVLALEPGQALSELGVVEVSHYLNRVQAERR